MYICHSGAIFIQPPASIWSHPELTNAEKWIDVKRTTTLGKLYNLYHEVKEAGLDVTKFDLVEPEPDQYFISNDDLYKTQHVLKDTLETW